MRERLKNEPENLPLALRLARSYLELGRVTGDPRYSGYAEAALAPWWDLAEPPEQVLLSRATMRQRVHQFDAALADLDAVLSANPRMLRRVSRGQRCCRCKAPTTPRGKNAKLSRTWRRNWCGSRAERWEGVRPLRTMRELEVSTLCCEQPLAPFTLQRVGRRITNISPPFRQSVPGRPDVVAVYNSGLRTACT